MNRGSYGTFSENLQIILTKAADKSHSTYSFNQLPHPINYASYTKIEIILVQQVYYLEIGKI